ACLGLLQAGDTFFDGALSLDPKHLHRLFLTDPVRAVGSLALARGVPPLVVVNDVCSRREIEPLASGKQAQHEYGRAFGTLEGIRDALPVMSVSIQVEGAPTLLCHCCFDPRRHLCVLAVHESLLACLANLLHQFGECLELSGSGPESRPVPGDEAGMA